MLILEKHKLKGTFNRSFLANVDDNLMCYGNAILNSDFSFTDLQRVFQYNQSNGDDNGPIAWNLSNPFKIQLNGSNGSKLYNDGSYYQNCVVTTNTDAHLTMVPLKSVFTSTTGATAGKKFLVLPGAYFHEINEKGEGRYIKGPGLRAYSSEFRMFFLGETNGNIYLLSNTNGSDAGEYPMAIFRLNKYTYATSYIGSISTATNAEGFLIRKEGNIFIFACFFHDGSVNSFYYVYFDMSSEKIYKVTSPSTPAYNSVMGVNLRPSNLTLDKSNSTKRKLYRVGGLSSDFNLDLKIYRYQMKETIDVTEGTNTVAECTLNNMSGFSLKPTVSSGLGPGWIAGGDMPIFTLTANSGNEYLFLYSKSHISNIPGNLPLNRQYWHLFSINSTDSTLLTRKQSNMGDGMGTGCHIFGMLKSWDFKTFVFMANEGFFVLRFDETSETFHQSQFYAMSYKAISLNDKNELVVQLESHMTYVFSITLASVVKVEFVDTNPSFNYFGSPITTNLKVNALDILGNRTESNVSLVAENATFTDNGTANLTVQTSDSADTIVGVTINSAGIVKITPSLIS